MPKRRVERSAREPGPIDIYIGERIREARLAVGMSQTELGIVVGTSFQQIQKYESGRNRITAARLYEVCKALNVDIGELLAEMLRNLR